MDHSSLHEFIILSFLRRSRPPTIGEIQIQFRVDERSARQSLRALADYHGVVLHPESDEIWICHPFSASPTTCVVSSDNRQWWGNCAWCSLGVMHLADGTTTLTTRAGGIGEAISITAKNGYLSDADYVVHFPVPMSKAWDNVIYTCSVQLLFRDEAQVDEWCATRGIPKGDVRPLKQIWEFAKEWYGQHANANWTKWTLCDAMKIFHRHGLDGPVWDVGETSRRF